MLIQFLSVFLVNSFFSFIQGFLQTQDNDRFFIYWAKELLGVLVVVALFWLLSQLAVALLSKWGKRFATYTETDLDNRILDRTIPHVSKFLMTCGVYFAVRGLPLADRVMQVVSGIVYIVLIVILFMLVYQALDEFLKWYIANKHDGNNSVMSRQLLPIVEKLVSLFLLGTALIIVLKHFNVDIFSLVTALGIGSLAIGMAAKDTLAHMISGFTLMLDRPFRIGDRIQIASGQVGDVLDIGLRSTKIKTLDNQLLIIPNSDLCNTMVTNQAFPNSRVKGRINLGVGYGSDVEQVKQQLVSIALEIDAVLSDPPPEAFFVSYGDSALNMSLFFWVEEYSTLFATTDKVNCGIISRFREQQIEIPFPIRTIFMEKQA